eukprot:TRINITY_DN26297_c0_g1_i1.p1 TRINITY_DN26297_c0_g1~~TRINITY_DN26297_c0_g1_i1.p1  ORF type:complete len:343 (+),score=87.20 TRINITY_DN26297_c0_g1_i1:143-1171(+)
MRLFGAFNRGSTNPLEAELKRITDAELIDVPSKDALIVIVQSTHDPGDRREIMRHLNSCLTDTSQWRRIYGGLVLLEHLLQKAAPVLITEAAQGHHFDLVQRLTFLEKFDYSTDKRVQQMVQKKATSLRADMLAKIQSGDGDEDPVPHPATSSGASTASKPPAAATTSGPAGPVGGGYSSQGASRPKASKGGMLVNGIVNVGHRDDTTSESETERKPAVKKAPAQQNGNGHADAEARDKKTKQRQEAERRRQLEDTTDSSDSSSSSPRIYKKKGGKSKVKTKTPSQAPVMVAPPRKAPATVAESVDLLSAMDAAPAAQQAPVAAVAAPAPAPPPQEANLLDF